MTIGKDFKFAERAGLRFEAQAANLFNITNLGAPNTRFSNGAGTVNPNFGVISSVQQGEQAGPRTIQLSLRLFF